LADRPQDVRIGPQDESDSKCRTVYYNDGRGYQAFVRTAVFMAKSIQPEPLMPSLSRLQWGLQGYWFSFNLQGSALVTIGVPETVLRFSSRVSQTTLLAQIATLVALAAMVMSPITGMWSDRKKRRRGGRLQLLWWGTAFNVAGLFSALSAHSFRFLSACIIVAILGQTTAQSAYQAMMPEIVPRTREKLT